jgi:bifunctional polynucleotide phosphatase/kinase
MKQDEAYEAASGDILSLVYNSDFQYEVTFVDSSPKEDEMPKRPSQEDLKSDTPKRIKSENENQWDDIDNGDCLVFTSRGIEGRSKIAAYDMDNTLIKTVSGNVFPKNIDDWQLNYEKIPKKLQSLYESGFKIVVFTNQGGIASGATKANDIKQKIVMVQQRLGVPCQFFMATGPTIYRKPRLGMWKALEEKFNDGVKIDRTQSFYVGDAAGRPEVKLTKRKKDHSCADRLFALNLGLSSLSFFTPEEHFLNAKDTPKNWNRPGFDPKSVSTSINLLEPSDAKLTSGMTEIVLLVGYPGSGKSFFSKEHLESKGYVIINRDTLNSAQKCIAAAEATLEKKKSCVIDNTNPDVASRKRFIDVAKKHSVPIRCFLFNVTYDQAKHNNIFRELTGSSHQKISDMIYNIYKKNYVEPSKKEGFNEIIRVNFLPKFPSSDYETLYKMYLVEK